MADKLANLGVILQEKVVYFDDLPIEIKNLLWEDMWICHAWSDEQCIKFLKNCYEAIPDDGRVIVSEHVLPEEVETSHAAKFAFQFDAIMMAVPNGKERTEEEFQALAKAAGFKGFRVACSAYDTKVMEFLKKNTE